MSFRTTLPRERFAGVEGMPVIRQRSSVSIEFRANWRISRSLARGAGLRRRAARDRRAPRPQGRRW